MDHKAILLQTVPNMNGWCDPAKANHIFDTVCDVRPKTCVELGVFAGRSLIAFALALSKLGIRGSKIHGVDTWAPGPAIDNNTVENSAWWRAVNYDSMRRECEKTSNDLGVARYVQLHKSSTVDAFPRIPGPIDILHIDGNHSRWDSVRDVTMWVDKVKPGGIVYFDDMDWESTTNAVELLYAKCDELEKIKTTNVCGVFLKHGG